MADRKARCPECRLPVGECCCPDEDPRPPACGCPGDCEGGPECLDDEGGPLLRAMLGPEPKPGPPYVHVHRLPETEEEMAAAPPPPSFTISRERE